MAGVYQFGPFRLDERSRQLFREGELVGITPKVFDTLVFLVSNAGRTVSRDELIKAVWPDTFVEDGNLNYNMSQLRTILGECVPGVSYIQTVPKRGYRFVAEIGPKTTRKPFWIWAAAGCLILAAIGGILYARRVQSRPHQIKSLAVLPLRNLSNEPDQAYFTDGMTEALTTGLAQISALSVIARSSMARYSETKKAPSQIAREVNVDALVEGSVQRSGSRVRITAHLIDAATDRQIWARSFERDLRDVLTLQNEISRAIAEEIGAKITQQEQVRLRTVRPIDPDAQEFYLWGLYWTTKKGAGEKSRNYLQQAIRHDPGFAAAYAALANAYGVALSRGEIDPSEGYPKQVAALTKALELDENLAEAHNAHAFLLQFHDWNWSESEREYRRAIELNPNLAGARQGHAMWLACAGRMDEAIAETKRAVQLDPYDIESSRALGEYLSRARRYDESIERIRKNLEESNLTPFDVGMERILLGVDFLMKDQFSQAIEELEQAAKLTEGNPFAHMMAVGPLANAYAVAGRRQDALREIASLKQMSPSPNLPFQIAVVYTGLGNRDLAFQWLNKACDQRSHLLTFIKVDVRFDNLRSDPRYTELLHRIGLPE